MTAKTIAISLVYLSLLAGLTVINIGIDNQRMKPQQSRVSCMAVDCEPIHEKQPYSEEVIKYEDGSIYNPVTQKSYSEDVDDRDNKDERKPVFIEVMK